MGFASFDVCDVTSVLKCAKVVLTQVRVDGSCGGERKRGGGGGGRC